MAATAGISIDGAEESNWQPTSGAPIVIYRFSENAKGGR
jgi:hypothetical protein